MKYIANKNFYLKDIAGEKVLMASGTTAIDFNAIVVMNETAILLFNELQSEKSPEELAEVLAGKYGVDKLQALTDVQAFINKMLGDGIVAVVGE